jgi:hypothetical protein
MGTYVELLVVAGALFAGSLSFSPILLTFSYVWVNLADGIVTVGCLDLATFSGGRSRGLTFGGMWLSWWFGIRVVWV